MPRVLIVEDERSISEFLRRGLIFKDFEVETASSGDQALDVARDRPPDVVILDLMLPGMSGIEVCRRLRSAGDVPIIMLTARDAIPDKIEGLDAGADDYITKPFSFEELLARVRAALRRRAPGHRILQVGDLTIDPAGREVSRGSRAVELTPREFELLEFLAKHAGEAVPKQVIFEKVWGYDFDVDSDAIKVYIRYLRMKLNTDGEPDLIHTVRGVGYMLKG